MAETLLVPLDGSAFSDAAAWAAASTATRTGASLRLLSVASGDTRSEIQRHLDDLIDQLPMPTSATVIVGNPVEEILGLAGESPDTTIWMADRGRTAVGDLLARSVSEQILAMSPRPVVVVGPSCRPDWDASTPGPLVVCVDEGPECESILGPAAHLAKSADLEVVLVEVVPPEERVEIDDVPHVDAPTARGRRRLEEIARLIEGFGVEPPETQVLYGADIAEAVAHFATQRQASFIAAATHGLTGVRRLLHGSTTHHLIARSPCPILAVRCTPTQSPTSER